MKIIKTTLASVVLVQACSMTAQADQDEQYRGSVLKEKSKPEVVEKYRREAREKILCNAYSDETAARKYLELKDQRWDRNAMWCGMVYGAQWAADEWWNPVTQLTVLGSHLEYFEVLNKGHSMLVDSIETQSELYVRWAMARTQTETILQRAGYWRWLISEVELLEVLYTLVQTQRYAPSDEVNRAIDLALSRLPEFIPDEDTLKSRIKQERDADLAIDEETALEALVLEIYGSILLALPEFSGGDALAGIEHLERSLALNSHQLSVYSSLIEAYLGEREHVQAQTLLQKASAIRPEKVHPQDYVDYAKKLAGYAKRMQTPQLQKHFIAAREKLLHEQPYLLSREEKAVFGHGGENPITGKN